jgi:hypothetical protein
MTFPGKAFGALNNVTVEALTQYDSFESAGVEETTSDGWVVKSGFPYTTPVREAGTYVVDYSAALGQSKSAKNVGFRVEWRMGTSGTWIELENIQGGLAAANTYELRTGFQEITITSNSVIQLQISWGQTIETGTGRIRNAAVKIGRKGD